MNSAEPISPDEMRQKLQEYLDNASPEELRAELDKRKHLQMVDIGGRLVPLSDLPWWKKDKYGWPIETIKGRPVSGFVRIVLQNIRKIGI